jgi:hypothetical protein
MTETPEGPGAETPPTPDPPKPDTGTEPSQSEVEKWKALARKHEERAKENAEAAKKVQQLEDAQKSEQQRLEERAAAAERERDKATADALRYRVAAQHGISGDDVDLLEGVADPDLLEARAKRIAELRKAAEKTPAQPTPSRPKENLRPGATPNDQKSEDDLVYEQLFGAK